MNQFSRRSTMGLLGGAMTAVGASGRKPVDAAPPAAAMRALSGYGIDVRAYGAVADNKTDNASAFEAAIAAGVAAGRPIFVPAATSGYATSRSLKPVTGLIGEGRGSVIRALSAEAFAGGRPIVHIGWKRSDNPAVCTVPITGFRVVGAGIRPARRSSDPKVMGFEGNGILFDESAAFIHMVDVGVDSCRKGVVHATLNGHIGGTNVFCTNNWYNLYWDINTGDYRYIDGKFTGALLATYGCHGSRRSDADFGGIFGLTTIGCHGGFSPYLFYQEDGDGSVGLVGWTSINSSAEQIGNQVIRLGRTPKGTQRVSSGWFVVSPGHSWTVPGTPEHPAYAITGEAGIAEQLYAVDLDLVQGGPIEMHGIGWVGGRSGRHTRIANLLDWVADDNGIGGYEVTGGGAERLTYARAQRLRQSRTVDLHQLRAGMHEVARLDIPPSYDNTPGGELLWSLAYAARGAPAAALRFVVRVEGEGVSSPQPLTPQYLVGSVGNLNGHADIGIGRRDRQRGRHGIRLFVEIPEGSDIASLTGSVTMIVEQDTGIVG